MISSFGKSINNFFSWYLDRRISEIRKFMDSPIEAQNDTFMYLLDCGKNTEFGKKYSLKEIDNQKKFKSRIPLQSYADLRPYISKIKNGETNVLWPGKVHWFAQSSGTANKEIKHIPITKDSLVNCHYKGGKDLLALYYNENPETKLFVGKHLIAGGSSEKYLGKNKTTIGDLSAIIMKQLPWWCEWRRSPRKKNKILSDDWHEKLEHIITCSVKDDVHIIAGVPSWIYIILGEILERLNVENINEVWPNLELYLHGGVNIEPYKSSFSDFFDKKINYYQNYNATEGFFGLQCENDSNDMLLMLDYGIYYEFIRKQDWKTEQPTTLTLEEIKLFEPYEIVISTNGGLWRYRLEDTVIFTCKSPYKIKVIGRTNQFLNTFGEEIMINNLEHALSMASKKTSAKVKEFTVCPVIKKRDSSLGYHHWLIEFKTMPNCLKEFKIQIENSLFENNIDYFKKRKNNSPIRSPKISIVKEGTFKYWMKEKGKLGGQNKVPRICQTSEYINEILKIEEII